MDWSGFVGGAGALAVNDSSLRWAFAVGVAVVGEQLEKAVLHMVFRMGGHESPFALPAD